MRNPFNRFFETFTRLPKLPPSALAIIFLIIPLLVYGFAVRRPDLVPPSLQGLLPEEESGEDEATSDEAESDSEEPTENGTDREDGTTPKEGEQKPSPKPKPKPKPEPEPEVVLCLGDSVTAGYPYGGTSKTYPARLQAKLNTKYGSGAVSVVNKGQGGWRADQVLGSVNGWLQSYDPDLVLLMVGGNDLIQETNPKTYQKFLEVAAQTTAEVQQIINKVKSHTNPDGSHPKIIVSAFIPNLLGVLENLGIIAYNLDLASDLTGYDRYFSTNWSDLYDTNTKMAKSSLMSDSVHPNETGYSIMADNWYAEVIEIL